MIVQNQLVMSFWRSRFARNVAIVASGTAGAQAISLAFAPFITRIYGPEAFGLLGTFVAIVSLAVPLAALAYPIAIVLPRDDQNALALVRLSLVLSLLIALLFVAMLSLGDDLIVALLQAESISSFVYLIPAAVLFSGWVQISQQWLIRKNEFGTLARTSIAHSLILNSAKCGIGMLYPSGPTLIILALLGAALNAVMLFFGAWVRYSPAATGQNQDPRVLLSKVAHQYRDFPIYRAPQIFINAGSQSLPVLMLAVFFGPISAGYYVLARMVLGMPAAVVGKAVKDVFYPYLNESAHRGDDLLRPILSATGALLLVAIVPFGLVIFFGPSIFTIVFGGNWTTAGEYARWLALFYLFHFINQPSVAAVPVLGIQRGLLIYEVFSTGAKTVGLVIGFYWFQSDLSAVGLFSVMGAAAYTLMIIWIILQASRRKYSAEASR